MNQLRMRTLKERLNEILKDWICRAELAGFDTLGARIERSREGLIHPTCEIATSARADLAANTGGDHHVELEEAARRIVNHWQTRLGTDCPELIEEAVDVSLGWILEDEHSNRREAFGDIEIFWIAVRAVAGPGEERVVVDDEHAKHLEMIEELERGSAGVETLAHDLGVGRAHLLRYKAGRLAGMIWSRRRKEIENAIRDLYSL